MSGITVVIASGQIIRGFVLVFIRLVVNRAVQLDIIVQIIVNIVKIFFFSQFFCNFVKIINVGGRVVFFKSQIVDIIAVHHLQIDNISQLHCAVQQFVAPAGNGLNGHRAFAQTVNHHRLAGFNTFGNGYFAFAGKQFNRSHLFKIHSDRVVVASQFFLVEISGFVFLINFNIVVFNHIRFKTVHVGFGDNTDAQVGNTGHNVFNMFGRFSFRRQSFIQFFYGNISAQFSFINQTFNCAS